MNMHEKHAERFNALGHPVRFALFLLIIEANGAWPVNKLVDALNQQLAPHGIGQPAVSHHISTLCEAGFIVARCKGIKKFYVVCPDALAEMAQIIETMRAVMWQEVAV